MSTPREAFRELEITINLFKAGQINDDELFVNFMEICKEDYLPLSRKEEDIALNIIYSNLNIIFKHPLAIFVLYNTNYLDKTDLYIGPGDKNDLFFEIRSHLYQADHAEQPLYLNNREVPHLPVFSIEDNNVDFFIKNLPIKKYSKDTIDFIMSLVIEKTLIESESESFTHLKEILIFNQINESTFSRLEYKEAYYTIMTQ